MRKKVMTILGCVALAALTFAPAQADDTSPGPTIVAAPDGQTTGFLTPAMVAVTGQPLNFVNADALALHNVISCHTASNGSNACDIRPDGSAPWCYPASNFYLPGRCPLFWSPLKVIGNPTPIYGLDDGYAITGRTYQFYCEPHKTAMTGTLVLLPNPT
ncbi:MAG: hypothetical protein ABR548_00530 [Actinomycetota bacterium]|nr:hypothetical protein [Actinomycetota bacterium]